MGIDGLGKVLDQPEGLRFLSHCDLGHKILYSAKDNNGKDYHFWLTKDQAKNLGLAGKPPGAIYT